MSRIKYAIAPLSSEEGQIYYDLVTKKLLTGVVENAVIAVGVFGTNKSTLRKLLEKSK